VVLVDARAISRDLICIGRHIPQTEIIQCFLFTV